MALSNHNAQAIPFGLHPQSQHMLTVTDVAKGLACNCVCVACGTPLMAKQGKVRTWHFAHSVETNCKTAAEAAIHQMAKQLVAQHRRLFLPHREHERDVLGKFGLWSETISTLVQSQGIFPLEDCQIEKTLTPRNANESTFRPDVLANLNGSPIAIEIFNTHAVSEEKAKALEAQGVSVLEIEVHDILEVDPRHMLAELEEILFEPSDKVKWLAHVGDSIAQTSLDATESRLRTQWKPKEERLLREHVSRQKQEERKRAYREKMREVEYATFPAPGGQILIARNPIKVTLKVFGHLQDELFREICHIGRKLGGRFNDKYRKWEFFKGEDQSQFLTQLQTRVEDRIQPYTTKTAGTRIFSDAGLQEQYEERAAILQFESGLNRAEAERQAFLLIISEHTNS